MVTLLCDRGKSSSDFPWIPLRSSDVKKCCCALLLSPKVCKQSRDESRSKTFVATKKSRTFMHYVRSLTPWGKQFDSHRVDCDDLYGELRAVSGFSQRRRYYVERTLNRHEPHCFILLEGFMWAGCRNLRMLLHFWTELYLPLESFGNYLGISNILRIWQNPIKTASQNVLAFYFMDRLSEEPVACDTLRDVMKPGKIVLPPHPRCVTEPETHSNRQ